MKKLPIAIATLCSATHIQADVFTRKNIEIASIPVAIGITSYASYTMLRIDMNDLKATIQKNNQSVVTVGDLYRLADVLGRRGQNAAAILISGGFMYCVIVFSKLVAEKTEEKENKKQA